MISSRLQVRSLRQDMGAKIKGRNASPRVFVPFAREKQPIMTGAYKVDQVLIHPDSSVANWTLDPNPRSDSDANHEVVIGQNAVFPDAPTLHWTMT